MCPCPCPPVFVGLPQTRSPSSSGDSADGADDDCSPKSHSTQLINIPEMAAQVAAEQQQDKARAAAAAAAMLEQQQAAADADILDAQSAQALEQRSVPDAAAVDVLAAAGQQQQQVLLPDGQPRAGLNARPLGSDEYSGSGEAVYTGDGEEDVLGEDGLPEDADRDLSVACQQAEENKLSFQLKFTEPEGECCSIAGRLGACHSVVVVLLSCTQGPASAGRGAQLSTDLLQSGSY